MTFVDPSLTRGGMSGLCRYINGYKILYTSLETDLSLLPIFDPYRLGESIFKIDLIGLFYFNNPPSRRQILYISLRYSFCQSPIFIRVGYVVPFLCPFFFTYSFSLYVLSPRLGVSSTRTDHLFVGSVLLDWGRRLQRSRRIIGEIPS